MGDTDGVGAHVLHDGHLAVDGVVISGSTQGTLVMVHAHAIELDSLAVEVEAGGLPLDPAVAEGILAGVDNLAVHQNLRAGGVQVGILQGPQGGVRNLDLQLGLSRGTGGNGNSSLADSAVDGGADSDLGGNSAVIDHVDLDGCGAVVIGDVGGGDGDAVQIHVDGLQGVQGHVTVDAGAGVPAGGGQLVDGLDGHHVLGSTVANQIIGDVKGKVGIAEVMLTHGDTIDIDIGMHIHAVEVQQEGLVLVLLVQRKALAVPAGAAGQEAGLCFTGSGEVLGDGEVVGKVHSFPCGVIEVRVGCAGVTQVELPALVEVIDPLGCDVSTQNNRFGTADDGGSFCSEGPGGEHGNDHDHCQEQRKQTGRTESVLHTFTSFCLSAWNSVPKNGRA